HTPLGSGGGEMGTPPPPDNGAYKLSGGIGSLPGTPGRLNSADSNSTGGTAREVPSPAPTGSSNFATGGSGDEFRCCGTSTTGLAQRGGAVIFPSVLSFSPLCRVMRCRHK